MGLLVLGFAGMGLAERPSPTLSPPPETDFESIRDSGSPFVSVPYSGSILHDAKVRTFYAYIPVNLPPMPVPLVVVLHGGAGNAVTAYGVHEGRWEQLAELHDFIVLYPQGRPDPGSSEVGHWNDCRADVTDPVSNSIEDDVGFIDALIARIASEYSIATNHVYAVGESNGGMMAYRLALEAGTRYAAVAAIVSNLPLNSECAPGPSAPVPMLIMNGTADDFLIPYDGGCVAGCDGGRGEVISTQATVDFWVQQNQTALTPTTNSLPDVATNDMSTVTVLTYADGLDGSEVVLYRIDGGGHTVPGPSPSDLGSVVGPKNHDIWAADEIWAFFQRH